MELPISTPKEDTDNEDDQESDDEEFAIPRTAQRTPHPVKESFAVYHVWPDAQLLSHEWFTERDIFWSQKSHHKHVAETSHAFRRFDPPISFASIGRIFGVRKGTIAHHFAGSYWYEQKEGRPTWLVQWQ
jgi:hypothetical protein